MKEQCSVAEAERQHDVEYIEPLRHKAMFTGLEVLNLDHQKLLQEYAADELTQAQEALIKEWLLISNGDVQESLSRIKCNGALHGLHEAMQNIARSYIVDFLETELQKHCEDWLYENYGVYDPEEV